MSKPVTLVALQFLFAATHLTTEEWAELEDVLRSYCSEDPLNADHIKTDSRENWILDSLYHKGLISTGMEHHDPMDICPTPLCWALYGLSHWVDREPRNAYHAIMVSNPQLPMFVCAPDYSYLSED